MSFAPSLFKHDFDVADNFASKSLNRMRQDDLPPVPQNFEVWYVYYANINPNLRDEINQKLQEQEKITEQDCRNLYEKYLSSDYEREVCQRAGDQISTALHDVSDIMRNVQDTTSQFTGVLKDATSTLDTVSLPDEIKKVLATITEETDRMLQYNVELEKRLDQSSAMMDGIKRDMDRIRREAVTDGLTGIANRKSFDEQIHRLCRESKRDGSIFSLIMIDIDHFKAFNDTYGHQVGDQVLRLVAMTLVNEVKGQDMVARYGGEEFVILLPGTNVNAAQAVSENLRKAIEKKEVLNSMTGNSLGQITISLGVAQFYSSEDVEDLISRADKALYSAKNKGRNQVSIALTPHEIEY